MQAGNMPEATSLQSFAQPSAQQNTAIQVPNQTPQPTASSQPQQPTANSQGPQPTATSHFPQPTANSQVPQPTAAPAPLQQSSAAPTPVQSQADTNASPLLDDFLQPPPLQQQPQQQGSSARKVPWALAPPKNDLPRPGSAGKHLSLYFDIETVQLPLASANTAVCDCCRDARRGSFTLCIN